VTGKNQENSQRIFLNRARDWKQALGEWPFAAFPMPPVAGKSGNSA
jgi:hypothetical protein